MIALPPSFYRRHCIQVARIVFWKSDTLTVRLLLAWGSLLYAVLMLWGQFGTSGTHAALIWMYGDAAYPEPPLPLFDRPS